MGKDLIFPKSNEGKEDPAILAARKSLGNKKKTANAGTDEHPLKQTGRGGYRGRKPRCYLCGGEFEKSELKSAWSIVIQRQGNFCGVCIKSKNDPDAFRLMGKYAVKKDNTGACDKSSKTTANHYPGKKDDSEKLHMNLLPWDALEEVAKVLTVGAKKYAPDNWRIVPDAAQRYEAALVRHLAAYKKGEDLDPEDGLSHLAHLACNALFLVSFRECGK